MKPVTAERYAEHLRGHQRLPVRTTEQQAQRMLVSLLMAAVGVEAEGPSDEEFARVRAIYDGPSRANAHGSTWALMLDAAKALVDGTSTSEMTIDALDLPASIQTFLTSRDITSVAQLFDGEMRPLTKRQHTLLVEHLADRFPVDDDDDDEKSDDDAAKGASTPETTSGDTSGDSAPNSDDAPGGDGSAPPATTSDDAPPPATKARGKKGS